MKDPGKVLLPNGDLVFITVREEESGDCIPSPLLGDPPLNAGHSSVIEASVGEGIARRARGWSDSLGQISNRIDNGLVQFIQLSPLQSPVEYLAYVSTSPPELDVILIVRRCVLN